MSFGDGPKAGGPEKENQGWFSGFGFAAHCRKAELAGREKPVCF
jgi:hypothetical protein